MWRDLGLTQQEWELTPPAVRAVLISLQHRSRLLELRCAAYEQQLAALTQQTAELALLKAEVAELRERLGQNSRNSSQPPSADPPQQRRPNTKATSGRKPGGQPGHQGQSRHLSPLAEVDHVIDLRPVSCAHCGSLLLGADPQPERHQVSEVPLAKAVVTEYRRHRLGCSACGAQTQAAWPAEMPAGSFGSRAQAIVGYLSGRLGASHRDVSEVMGALHGLAISTGSIAAIEQRVSTALAQPVAAAQRFVTQQRAQYVDETSWYEGEQQHWLWVNTTAEVTAFQILAGRGAKQAQQIINEQALGIITSDRHSAYLWVDKQRRQVCWAHLKRDFQAIAEREGDSAVVGRALLEQTGEVFRLWHESRSSVRTGAQLPAQMAPVQQRVKELLEAGSRSTHAKTRHTCQNVLKLWSALWTFVRAEGVEPTNNAAERALRRAVLWRRKSFGTQSARGSQFVARILTVIATLRQQGRDVLEYLTAACAAAVLETSAPSLAPGAT